MKLKIILYQFQSHFVSNAKIVVVFIHAILFVEELLSSETSQSGSDRIQNVVESKTVQAVGTRLRTFHVVRTVGQNAQLKQN